VTLKVLLHTLVWFKVVLVGKLETAFPVKPSLRYARLYFNHNYLFIVYCLSFIFYFLSFIFYLLLSKTPNAGDNIKDAPAVDFYPLGFGGRLVGWTMLAEVEGQEVAFGVVLGAEVARKLLVSAM
jgi:hypothetical protein